VKHRAALLAALATLAWAPAAHATFPGGNGRIAYDVHGQTIEDSGRRGSYRSLVTVNPDGRGDFFVRECTLGDGPPMGDCSIDYRSPAWAPGGRRLAFDAGRSLALVNRDGSGFVKLAPVTSNDGEPAWSPSGARLAFTSAGDLYVASASARGARRVARRAGGPDFSRRGLLAFERGGSVHSMRADGRGVRRIARGKDPSWSPTGRTLALARRDGIYVVRADGRRLRRVLRCSRCATPAFSPNGKLLVLDSAGLVVVRVSDGRRVARLTSDVSPRLTGEGFASASPDWQPR
jgi:Tol biopolymer transport system component